MNDREKWRERVRDIRASGTTWWWWWWWWNHRINSGIKILISFKIVTTFLKFISEASKCARTYTHTHTQIRSSTHTCTPKHTHTHIYTQTPTRLKSIEAEIFSNFKLNRVMCSEVTISRRIRRYLDELESIKKNMKLLYSLKLYLRDYFLFPKLKIHLSGKIRGWRISIRWYSFMAYKKKSFMCISNSGKHTGISVLNIKWTILKKINISFIDHWSFLS